MKPSVQAFLENLVSKVTNFGTI